MVTVEVKMSDAKDILFTEASEEFNEIYAKYNILPKRKDFISCNVGGIHQVEGVQYLLHEGKNLTICIWLFPDYVYLDSAPVKEYLKDKQL